MESKKLSQTLRSIEDLSRALTEYSPTKSGEPRSLSFLAVTKAFEVSLEYIWKYFKYIVEDKGLEAASPKDAIRAAAETKLTDSPELYIKAINARNQSMHDYFTMSEEDFVKLIENFLRLAQKDLEQ